MRLHLIDGTYELFRAHFSKRPDRVDREGRDIKATVGLIESLLFLLDDEHVTHAGVAFDNPIESFRNELFPGYKDSSGVDPALLAQFDRAEEAARAIGLVVWSMDRYEADDALATAAHRYADRVEQVRICTIDKDLGQCVRGGHVVQVDRRNQREFDEDAIREVRGVGPRSIPDLLALVGDTADGIPGIPGFGAKSAAAVLSVFEHVDRIPDDPSGWEGVTVRGAATLAATLAGRRDDALAYRELATLVTDVPLLEDLDDLAWAGVPRGRFLAWCDELDLEGVRDRPQRWA